MSNRVKALTISGDRDSREADHASDFVFSPTSQIMALAPQEVRDFRVN